jgi:hypothetical protein
MSMSDGDFSSAAAAAAVTTTATDNGDAPQELSSLDQLIDGMASATLDRVLKDMPGAPGVCVCARACA